MTFKTKHPTGTLFLQQKKHTNRDPRKERPLKRERERWEGHLVARKLTWTKELGLKKKISFSLITSANTAKDAGDLSLEPPVIYTYYLYTNTEKEADIEIYKILTGLQRCGKSCRLRWMNYLRPDLKRGNFTEEEDELIIKLHSLLGNKLVSSLSVSWTITEDLERKKNKNHVWMFLFLSLWFFIYLKSDQNIHLQMVVDCWEISRKNRQRDQKLLEHSYQKKTSKVRNRSGNT